MHHSRPRIGLQLSLTLALLLLLSSHHALYFSNPFAHSTKHLPKPKAPTLDSHTPDKEVYQRPVTAAERQEDTEVAPLVAGLDIEGLQIVITNRIRTVLASSRRIWVEQVSRCLCDKSRSIARTRLARWRIKERSLSLLTLHRNAIQCSR